jgi:hypothetical protein
MKINVSRLSVYSFLAMAAMLFSAQVANAKMVILDNTDTTDDWVIAADRGATGLLRVADGPEKGLKGIWLNYNLVGGKWLNYGKEYRKNLSEAKSLVFWLKSQGNYTFEIKMVDLSGATYGVKIPGGTDVPEWKRVVLPISQMIYLGNGSNPGLDLQNIKGLYFAVSVGQESDAGKGGLIISQIQYSTDALPADLPAIKVTHTNVQPTYNVPLAANPEAQSVGVSQPGKPVDIGMPTTWRKNADKGASLNLTFGETPDKTPSIQAGFTWGRRAIPGVQEETGTWVSFARDLNMNLSEMRNIVFFIKSTGANANLEVKITDNNNCTYGKVYPNGSSVSNWTQFVISRRDLNYMWGGDGSGKFDWANVTGIEFGLSRSTDSRDTGAFFISNIRMESALTVPKFRGPEGEAPESVEAGVSSGRIKVPLDDFTDLNPTNRYFIVGGDESTLALLSSRIVFEADYSMDMRYGLSTTRPTGSWIEAQRRFTPTLNWTGVEAVKIWVRGDSSNNIFRVSVVDGDNNVWVADNTEVLSSGEWYLVSMPIDSFALYNEIALPPKSRSSKQLKDSLGSIRQVSLGVVSQPDKNSSAQGEMFVENLYLVGQGINQAKAVPLESRVSIGQGFPLKNWNIGGTSETFYDTMPNIGSVMSQGLSFTLTGNFEKFSVAGQLQTNSTFGNETNTFAGESDNMRSQSGTVVGPNTAITLLSPLPGISDMVVGNLYFAGSENIFANDNFYGGWEFKGLMAEGNINKITHHTYFMKGAPNSYIVAGQYGYTLDQLNLNLTGTYFNDEPFVSGATHQLDDDKAFLMDANQKVTISSVADINLRGQFGYDWYQKYWSNATGQPIDYREGGEFFQGEANFSELANIFWPGLSLTGTYRYVEPGFKPTLRQNPGSWDVEVGDQKLYQGRVYQKILSFWTSATYYKMTRLSNAAQGRENSQFAVGFIDGTSLDLTLTQEFRTRQYDYLDDRWVVNSLTPSLVEDFKQNDTQFYVGYHLSGRMLISENVEYVDTQMISTPDVKYKNYFFITKVAYYPAPNMTFTIENKFSGFGRSADIPVITGDPSTYYQYTWMKLDLTF